MSDRLLTGLAALGLGGLGVVLGVRYWQGKVARNVPMWQGPWAAVLGGLSFLVAGAAMTAQVLLDRPDDWWLLRRALGLALVLALLVLPSVLWSHTRWFPNRLRPPHERGRTR